jgi:hypothetical protein
MKGFLLMEFTHHTGNLKEKQPAFIKNMLIKWCNQAMLT